MTTRKSFLDLTRQGQTKRLKKYYLSEPAAKNKPFLKDDEQNSDEMVELAGSSNDEVNIFIENSNASNPDLGFSEVRALNFSETDESDIDECLLSEPDDMFYVNLRGWAEKFCITHVALSALLVILRAHNCFKFLPSDSRTLLQTPRSIVVKSVNPGQYHHIGISFWLKKIWSKCDEHIKMIELMFGIDGLPLFRSSCGELWPIIGSIFNMPRLAKVVFPVGLYYGSKKPEKCEDFLRDFVSEINYLTETGITLNGKTVDIKLKGIVCDAPAKSFILGTKGHSGYSSCTKCKQEGQYFSCRVTFPLAENNTPRTNEGFLLQEDPDFHNSNTPLTSIPGINFIKSFPLDYMHLVCLGVMRTMLYIWMFAPPPLKLNHRLISDISSNLISLQSFVPAEFCRKPRSLDQIKRWKATEYRQFLLYTGPLVLQSVLIPDYAHYFENFMTLHVAMRILLSPKLCHRHLLYAQGLLVNFVKTFKAIYGQQYITHNFHGLIHISDDVETFGNLDNCSAFKYENFLYPLKKLVRKGESPLQQISKRIMERTESISRFYLGNSLVNQYPVLKKPHGLGPTLEEYDPLQQYREVQFETFTLATSPPNSCCKLIDGSIAVVINIIHSKKLDSMGFLCKRFLHKSDLFGQPLCPSSAVGIFKVKDLSPNIEFRQFKDIEEKMFLLKKNDESFVFPLLHSE